MLSMSIAQSDPITGEQTGLMRLAQGSTSASNNCIRVEIIEDQAQGLHLWRELGQKIQNVPLSASPAWIETWLDQYAGEIRVQFLTGYRGDQLIGCCLLGRREVRVLPGLSVTELFIGTAGERHGHSVCVEYNDVLVIENERADFIHAILQQLGQTPGWHRLTIPGVHADISAPWCAEIPQLRLRKRQVLSRESRFFDLRSCREENGEILNSLGKSTRSNLKRRCKQLEPLEIQWAETETEALEIFEELIDLHQARWTAVGQPGAFASRSFSNFQRQLILRTFSDGRVVLARIQSQGSTIGCLYLLNDRQRLLDYVSGFTSFENAGSPGLVSHYLCMQEACQRGFEAYDFLVGEKRHKENLGKSATALEWIQLERSHLAFTLTDLARSGKQLLKKWVPNRKEQN
ncbi:MAG: GNAT family N-acetyltransferase [Planctomycetaceae bacterium]|nr:GNAT family N-acetyltransferase [Planctomycetaceae bacterium]